MLCPQKVAQPNPSYPALCRQDTKSHNNNNDCNFNTYNYNNNNYYNYNFYFNLYYNDYYDYWTW